MAAADSQFSILAAMEGLSPVYSCACSERALFGTRQGRLIVDELGISFRSSEDDRRFQFGDILAIETVTYRQQSPTIVIKLNNGTQIELCNFLDRDETFRSLHDNLDAYRRSHPVTAEQPAAPTMTVEESQSIFDVLTSASRTGSDPARSAPRPIPVPPRQTYAARQAAPFLGGSSLGDQCPFFLSGHCRDGEHCSMSHGDGSNPMYRDLIRNVSDDSSRSQSEPSFHQQVFNARGLLGDEEDEHEGAYGYRLHHNDEDELDDERPEVGQGEDDGMDALEYQNFGRAPGSEPSTIDAVTERMADLLGRMSARDRARRDAAEERRGVGNARQAEVKFYARVNNDFFTSRDELEAGNKVVLGAGVLSALMRLEDRYSLPWSFEITNEANGARISAGVLDFTSPADDVMCMPTWMMVHLGADNDTMLKIRAINLPKGTFCRLQSLSEAWLDVPFELRHPILECQLNSFQTLTQDSTITISYEGMSYQFKILECRPERSISIVNTDIETDIVTPEQFESENALVLGREVTAEVGANAYQHYTLKKTDQQPLPPAVTIRVTAVNGDPDVFVNQSTQCPRRDQYLVCCQSTGSKVLCVGEHTPFWNNPKRSNVISISIHSMLAPASYRLIVTPATEDEVATAREVLEQSHHELHPHGPPGAASLSRDTHVPDGSVRCPVCNAVFPKDRLVMHERHCAKRMSKCQECAQMILTTDMPRHTAIEHTKLACRCGLHMTQKQLHEHQILDCPERMVKCANPWCQLVFPYKSFEQHEVSCMMKPTNCVICSTELRYRDLQGHLYEVHNVDVSLIDWSQPLGPTKFSFLEPEVARTRTPPRPITPPRTTPPPMRAASSATQYDCACGRKFTNQELFHIHALTDCPEREVMMVIFSEEQGVSSAAAASERVESATHEPAARAPTPPPRPFTPPTQPTASLTATTAVVQQQQDPFETHDARWAAPPSPPVRQASIGDDTPAADAGHGAGWDCIACTFRNEDTVANCEMCDTPRLLDD